MASFSYLKVSVSSLKVCDLHRWRSNRCAPRPSDSEHGFAKSPDLAFAHANTRIEGTRCDDELQIAFCGMHFKASER